MIIKGLIDQNYKILDRGRLYLDNLPSPNKTNFTFPNHNGDNTIGNIDEDLPFTNAQETLATKSEVSFNKPNGETS